MKVKKVSIIVIAAISFFILGNVVNANSLSFGSYGNDKSFTMLPGEKRSAEVLFFNYGSKPLWVNVRVEGSRDIRTSVTPDNFVLEDRKNIDSDVNSGKWVAIDDGYIKALPVKVDFRIPSNISELEKKYYNMKVVGLGRTERESGEGIREDVSASYEYSFKITIPGNVNTAQENYAGTIEREKFYNKYTGSGGSEEGDRVEGNIDIEKGNKPSEERSGKKDLEKTPTGYFSLDETESGNPYLIILILAGLAVIGYFIYRR